MLICEYRVILPLTVEEYQLAQRFTVAEMSLDETGGGEGCEILKNEPFTGHPLLSGQYSAGQYTYKVYHAYRKIPKVIKFLFPKNSLEIYEESWNAYPYTRTVLTNPGYMKENFQLIIESLHHNSRGDEENPLQLPPEVLQSRSVKTIDIANDPISSKLYDPAMDPRIYKSTKTGRGPLGDDWTRTTSPVMTCYKLVTANFKWFGVQTFVERYIQRFEQNLFTVFHRRMFCSTDMWYGLTLEDVLRIETETKDILDSLRNGGPLRGGSLGVDQ